MRRTNDVLTVVAWTFVSGCICFMAGLATSWTTVPNSDELWVELVRTSEDLQGDY